MTENPNFGPALLTGSVHCHEVWLRSGQELCLEGSIGILPTEVAGLSSRQVAKNRWSDILLSQYFYSLFACAQGRNFISLWEGLWCWAEHPNDGPRTLPPPNVGKKRNEIWRELRFHRNFDGTLSTFPPAASLPQYSFVAERFKIHSLWPRRSRGFKLWILKHEYTKRFSVQLR